MEMTTLTITKARRNLGYWLKRAGEGEEIGIIDGDRIFALRPVQVEATDYAMREYGVSAVELDRFVEEANKEVRVAGKSGRLKKFRGDLDALI
jgi:antitoxin (DNA-binding transcriptional repressor) of toxin-antitoxin stability system